MNICILSISYGLGFVCNFLALIVFSTSAEFRRISTGFLFLLMTIFNFFHLCSLTIDFLYTCGYDLFSNRFFRYHWHLFSENLTRSMSTYLSVGIAIDRFLRSEFPLRARTFCTRKKTLILILIILLVLILYWSFYLFLFPNQNSSHKFFINNISIPLRSVLFCFLPIILMILANIRMIYNIRQAHNRINDVAQNNEPYRSSAIVSSTISGANNVRRILAVDRMLVYMLVSNILTFILTQIPFHIYSIIRYHIETFDDETHALIQAFLLIWSSIYFGIAFYLYCLASTLFRKKFIRIMKRILS